MRFSLRTLLFITSIACATMAWVEYHGLSYRWFWPPSKYELVGFVLLVVAHRVRPNLALPLAIAGVLTTTGAAVAGIHVPQTVISVHYGNYPGNSSYIEHVQLNCVAALVAPLVASLVAARLVVSHRRSFTPTQQAMIGLPCLIVAIDIFAHTYMLNCIARGW